MYYPILNLYENGDPEVIAIPGHNTSVKFSESCRITDGTSRHYWEISQDRWTIDSAKKNDVNNGLIFVAINEKITPSYLGNYSIIGFYTIIVYAIGTLIRRGIFGSSERVFISDMPRPDSLLLLCEGILISRLENNIEREEELYYILIDIIRSPEVIKMITDSSIKKKTD